MMQRILPVFMILFVEVSGFMEKSRKTSSLPQTICKCSAATTNTLRGQTSSIPSRISGLVKKEYSLLTALAGAGMIIFPKVTKAVMPATLGVDADGFFDGKDRYVLLLQTFFALKSRILEFLNQ